MAQHNFEGDIGGISENQLEFIRNVIKKHGYENGSVTFGPVGKAGDNYAASVKRIVVEGENGGMTMIAKIAPSHNVLRDSLNTFATFRNEQIMYSEFLPKLVQLQKEAGIPETEHLKYAKCYGSCVDEPDEVILLEDLKPQSYIMLDRFQSLSNDSVKSILKNFAKLHSLSYVLKHKEPLTYDNFKIRLIDMWAAQAEYEEMKMFFQTIEDETLSILEDPDHINFLRHKMADFMNLAVKFWKVDKESKYAVILQGDSWTNNILFRFEDDKVAESIMIDYQFARNNSPVCDIMYMIFNCTDHESRKQHYYDWIDYYHTELEKSLSEFDLKANFVYPRDRLDADLKQYAKLILGLSIFLSTMLTRKSADAEKVIAAMKTEDTQNQAQGFGISKLDEETKSIFKKRIIGFINSFTEFGLL